VYSHSGTFHANKALFAFFASSSRSTVTKVEDTVDRMSTEKKEGEVKTTEVVPSKPDVVNEAESKFTLTAV
jgi:hypothetical protein